MTVAFFRVALTDARQEGQVNGEEVVEGEVGWLGALREEFNWKANHSFKQAAQKVCRQSRRVRGEWRTSVQIYIFYQLLL